MEELASTASDVPVRAVDPRDEAADVEIEAAIIALGREPGGGLVVMPANHEKVSMGTLGTSLQRLWLASME